MQVLLFVVIPTALLSGAVAVIPTVPILITGGDVAELAPVLLREAPYIGILAVIVGMFLWHIQRSDKDRNETIKKMGDSCHHVQDRATAALTRNSEAIGELAAVMQSHRRFAEKIDRSAERLDRTADRMAESAAILSETIRHHHKQGDSA